jgi:DNA-binding response OmpR family regulator
MKRLLIVDDVPKIRKVLRNTLEKREFEVLEAANGMDAIMTIEKEPIDLVLMDIVMPDLGGLASLVGFRDIFNKTKVVLMTGKIKEDSEELRVIAHKLGVRHILFKPFRKAELFEIIDSLLGLKQT